jgi:hypothetical protein
MTGLTTDSACELIKGNKREDRASTRKSSYAANFFFEAFFPECPTIGIKAAIVRELHVTTSGENSLARLR